MQGWQRTEQVKLGDILDEQETRNEWSMGIKSDDASSIYGNLNIIQYEHK